MARCNKPRQEEVSAVGAIVWAMDELTDLETAVLDFERNWFKYNGAKESEIRERFDMSATAYYALLNRTIDKPAALVEDPMLVRRLVRLREARRRQRSAVARTFVGE